MTETISGGTALVEALVANGAHTAFGVPGESYLAVLDALVDAQEEIRFITCRHEAGAANMAEAAGKLTGAPGICFVTRGPGASHAAIALHTAFQDSTPLILFVGQVASDQVEREAFQEIDYRRFFSEVSKWSAEINSADRIAEYVGRAFRVATSGRPGPVVLALPEDMLTAQTHRQPSRPYTPALAAPTAEAMTTLQAMLSKAKRPMLMLGGSGWTDKSVADVKAFAGRYSLPVMASFRAQDRFNNDHPCYVGDMGIGANPSLVKRMQSSDLLIALGPRLGEMTTGGYSRLKPPVADVPLVHIHQGAEELGRVYQADLAIQAAPAQMAAALTGLDLPASDWSSWCREARADYEAWQGAITVPGPVKLDQLYREMRDSLPDDTIFTNGAGNYASWLHRFWRYRSFPSQLAPTSGAMGYGVPAAIAAKILHPDRIVVCAAGDGCFMMGATELATAAQYGAAILILVFNNAMYGTIRMHQERTYPGRLSATDLINPDFVAMAQAFGFHSDRVDETDAFMPAVKAALASGKPALIEVVVEPEAIAPTTSLSALRKSG